MNFQEAVIEKSRSKPVLVDFWAPWCGPCQILGPVLEELAEEQSDRWELVKVNTEEEQELAMEFGIRGIPNVKLFYRGEMIGEFSGALPKFQVERWLDQHLPDERDDELAALLLQLSQNGDALEKLEAFAQQNPDHAAARLALAEALVWRRPAEVGELLHHAELDGEQYEHAQDLITLADLMMFVPVETEELTPAQSKAALALRQAQEALQNHDSETGIRRLIDAVMADKSYAQELPRRAAIALFRNWGEEHDLTKRFRKLFNMALY